MSNCGIKYITYNKRNGNYRVAYKDLYIGSSKDLEEAKKMLDDFFKEGRHNGYEFGCFNRQADEGRGDKNR